ncbi:MAG: 30S ribosomal protein S6 [Bacteroidota bacterium]
MIQAAKLYETAFIVNASLDDPVIDGIIDKVKDVIVKNGGEIVDIAKWGRKRFAFPIKKKNNGFYVVCEFKAHGPLPAKLEHHYLLDENILRFLTIALDKKALKSRISASDLMKQNAPPSPAAAGSPAEAAVITAPTAGTLEKN